VLAWATFVESWYGTEAVNFGIYEAWWFNLLLGLLGLNVLCAAMIPLPVEEVSDRLPHFSLPIPP